MIDDFALILVVKPEMQVLDFSYIPQGVKTTPSVPADTPAAGNFMAKLRPV